MPIGNARSSFRQWRRTRPFWGGLLLLLAAAELFASANLTLRDLQVHFGQEGYLSYVLPAVLLLCGVLTWTTPAQRLFYGVLGLLTALYSFLGLNLGGFGLGMLLGIVGGALTIAWGPPKAALSPQRKVLAITLVPLAVTAAVLAGGGRTAARADACPAGLPSRAATAGHHPATPAPGRKPAATASAPQPTAAGNPVVDGWNRLLDGVGKLLGIGGSATPSPTAPTAPPGHPTAPPTPSASPSSRQPTRADVPCLGPRVLNKRAGARGVPLVTARGALLEGRSLEMYDSTYDGTVKLPTAAGPLRTLKFSMARSVTRPFSLTVPEPDGRTTVIRSDALTTEGHVTFYTPRFQGKLFGLIPVTFTPDSPPPLTLPYLKFTDVRITLAFVSCDTLTADPLDLTETV